MYIIAKDGSGDFTSLQAAIDAVPMSSRMPTILLLRMDEYHEKVIVNKDNIRIIGEARDRTVITNSGCAKDLDADGKEKGTFLSYTFLVTGNNVEVENLTIRNDAGDGLLVGQAVAVYAAGDRGVWRNVRMIAHQDTLFCGPTMPKVARDALPRLIPEGVTSVGDCPLTLNRQYFEDCYIQGDVDFIFGPYRCWFERCTLFMNKRGGLYTAANTPGAVAVRAGVPQLQIDGRVRAGSGVSGRPWRAFARTVFLHCEMDEHVSPQGFQDWQGGAPVTERYAEYGTTGRARRPVHPPSQAEAHDRGGRGGVHHSRGDWRIRQLASAAPHADVVPLRRLDDGGLSGKCRADDGLGTGTETLGSGKRVCGELRGLRALQQVVRGGKAAEFCGAVPAQGRQAVHPVRAQRREAGCRPRDGCACHLSGVSGHVHRRGAAAGRRADSADAHRAAAV